MEAMTREVLVRDETPEDVDAVQEIETAAFGQPDEAKLVAALRAVPGVVSLVAARGDMLVGHLLLSPVRVEGATSWDALALGPMAVSPGSQCTGVGSALVRAALERASALGAPAVIVLGHPEYYPRFGFVTAGAHGLSCKWPVPPEAYMVYEVEPGWLDGHDGGLVHYDAAFDDVT